MISFGRHSGSTFALFGERREKNFRKRRRKTYEGGALFEREKREEDTWMKKMKGKST